MGEKKGRIVVSFSLPVEDAWLLECFDRLARMEYGGKGRSRLLRRAMVEYLERHASRNLQATLLEDPVRAERARLEAGIRFLKARCRLSIRQIARITGWSRSRVQRITKGIKAKPVRTGHFDVNSWRRRWMLFKRGVKAEEAFRL